jgi:HEXXH motif-containing protein
MALVGQGSFHSPMFFRPLRSLDSFLPQSEAVVVDLDRRMRAKLASSLAHIFDRTASMLGVEDVDLRTLLSEIAAHRQAPWVFASYFELVFALKAKRYDGAAHLWRRIAAAAGQTPIFEVAPLTPEALGEDAARFVRLLNAAEKGPIYGPPDRSRWPAFAAGVAEALSFLEETDAALAAEIGALIVLVIGSAPLSRALSFGGVTSLTLWGAVTLNTETHRTPLEILEGLVHEGAHTLLFGYALDERLVRNPDSQRFASPLRSDPRPMDGVFHATFVCARLYLFYRRLLERRPESLNGFDTRAIERKMAGLASRFDDGARLIADKASLTPLGEKVLRSTVDYMSHDA